MKLLFVPLLLLLLASSALAQAILRDAHLDQHVGQNVPINLVFTDDLGQSLQLKDFLQNRPALLILGYYACPDLCPMTLRHVTQGLNGIALQCGRDFDVIFVSIDPRETPADAAAKKIDCTRAYKGQAAGWHFLTGSQSSIDALKAAVGFHCVFDSAHNRFAHAAGVMVLTPDARLAHYFFGIDYSPADLESALKDAAAQRFTPIAKPEQQYCFFYDPAKGQYGLYIWRSLRIAAAVWIALLGGYIGHQLLKEHLRSAARKEVQS